MSAPLQSLISKSEKALQKLAPGSWQHAMLHDHLAALYLGRDLIRDGPQAAQVHALDALHAALASLATMIGKSETAQARLTMGSAQHTLLKNRIAALEMARAHIQAAASRHAT